MVLNRIAQVDNFGSLPHRKQNYKKPLRRSKSDASTKKSKRNSIFNFFNSTPASTTNSSSTTNPNNSNSSNSTKRPVNSKRVTRSKSDVGNSQSLRTKRGNKLPSLSQNSNENSLTVSSDSENNNASLTASRMQKIPLSPITEVNTPLLDEKSTSKVDYFDSIATNSNNIKPNNNHNSKGEALTEGVTKENCENSLKQRSDNLKYLSKSMESMHSSQMPAEKLPLTKHVRVDKIIKRLSVERFSPPPLTVLQAGGFSYTNPQLSPKSPTATKSVDNIIKTVNDDKRTNILNSNQNNSNSSNILYTQVVCNEIKHNADESRKTIQNDTETVHNTLKTSRMSAASPPNLMMTVNNNNIELARTDTNDFINTHIVVDEQKTSRKQLHIDENFDRDETDHAISTTEEEPIIKANIRKHIPRYSSNSNIDNLVSYNQHQQNYFLDTEFDRLNEMRETDYNNGIDATLSSRREILESRIKSRIGGLHHNNNDNSHTRSVPPTTKRTYKHHHGSNEFINNRYSPERKHLDYNKSSSPPPGIKYEQRTIYLDDNSLRKSTPYSKFNDKYTDSGNETDIVVNRSNGNNSRNRYSSRFNIG